MSEPRATRRSIVRRVAGLLALCLTLVTPGAASERGGATGEADERRFWLEGPAWLLDEVHRERIAALDPAERRRAIARFLGRDPIPETPENELRVGIERRRELVLREVLTFFDDRARLLFVNGPPDERRVVDCSQAFEPLELWAYGAHELILYRPRREVAYRLWLPLDAKRALYTREMSFWLEEWEAHPGRGQRIDRMLCPEARAIDAATGVDALTGARGGAPDERSLLALLQPPSDLAAWAVTAATTRLPDPSPALGVGHVETSFPGRLGERMESRSFVALTPESPLEAVQTGLGDRLRLSVDGVVESGGALLDRFRLRFELEPPQPGGPVVLAVDRALEPSRRYTVRLRITDEVGGGEVVVSEELAVPAEPDAGSSPGGAAPAGERRARQLADGADSLVLLVPPRDVVFGRLRVQAAVSGERIRSVRFLVDDEPQVTRNRPPYVADLALPRLPRELVIGAEGLDENGEVVESDRVALNQPRGRLEIDVVEPARGAAVGERFTARVAVVVPEGRVVDHVDLQVNDGPPRRLETPPWAAELSRPAGSAGDVVFVTASVELDDGSRAEDVRFVDTPYAMGEVEVHVVELYATVLDRAGGLVRDLEADDFRVFEDGREQTIAKFELVDDLPLTLGVVLDTSGSMFASLDAARRAAVEFLQSMVTPLDECFAVGFASEPELLMHRTADVGAVEAALGLVEASGWTALHDAVVFGLYTFRGVAGRRALVVLSDGDDTDSVLAFEDALEYARQSGTVIYAIGLDNDALDRSARRKLERLAVETGGRSFVIGRAEELRGAYREIEAELRSQYLIAYASDRDATDERFREVEVEIERRGLNARTIRGYYP